MNILERTKKLERDVAEFKTSQALGNSVTTILPITSLSLSGSAENTIDLIIVYRSDSVVNPLIMPRVEVMIDGAVVDNASTYPRAYLEYDEWLAKVWLSDVNINLDLDEHTAIAEIRIEKSRSTPVTSFSWQVTGVLMGVDVLGRTAIYDNLGNKLL